MKSLDPGSCRAPCWRRHHALPLLAGRAEERSAARAAKLEARPRTREFLERDVKALVLVGMDQIARAHDHAMHIHLAIEMGVFVESSG